MIGLDTNVLVRYFTQDDGAQSRKATELIEGTLTEQEPGFVSLVTLVEMAWALDRGYGLSGAEVAALVEGMLQSDTLLLQNEQEVFTAMVALRAGRGSFADALVGELGLWAGCSSTVTLDRKAARLDGFRLLS